MQATSSAVGKTVRMHHIFGDDGKAVMLAINHGIALGPAKGIDNLETLFGNIQAAYPDSITLHKGMAMRMADKFAGKSALILKGTNSTRFFHPDETPVASVEEAVILGADAIAIGLSLADPNERQAIQYTAQIVAAAERMGMPTVTHSYPCGSLISDKDRYSVDNVGYATRVSLELGIDIIKTYWTGDANSFEKIVKIGSPAKVVISGGPKCDTLTQCFEMTYQGMQAGAAGITYGRNIWQHEYPSAVLAGLNAIVHKNASISTAMELAEDFAHAHLK